MTDFPSSHLSASDIEGIESFTLDEALDLYDDGIEFFVYVEDRVGTAEMHFGEHDDVELIVSNPDNTFARKYILPLDFLMVEAVSVCETYLAEEAQMV